MIFVWLELSSIIPFCAFVTFKSLISHQSPSIVKAIFDEVVEPDIIAGFSGLSERMIIGFSSVPSAEPVNIYPFGVAPL